MRYRKVRLLVGVGRKMSASDGPEGGSAVADAPSEERGHEEGRWHTGGILAEISTRIVRLHKETYGKGPTKARTYYDRDLVVCVLGGAFTRVEQTLAENGKVQAVLDQRSAWQDAMRGRFIAMIEEVTGRKVLAFISGTHHDPDLVTEMFLLEPMPEHDGEPYEHGS
jgi:uncharacterized protein YbcI